MVHSRTVVVLSGPIASGKTTLVENLKRLRGAACVSTSSLIAAKEGHELDRSSLQDLGMTDAFQAGDWLVDALRHVAAQSTNLDVLVVDALRTIAQLHAIKKASRGIWKVLHVHLTGEEGQLADRSQARREDAGTWDQMMSSPAEQAVQALALEADTVIDTTRTTPADVAVRVAARIRRPRAHKERCVDVLLGGQWGSEGKGNLAFLLAPEYDLLIRTGAPNAGHKVRTYSGAVYTHRQLPSGTLATDAPMLLGPGTVIDMAILLREIAECRVTPDRLAISPTALIIEERDVASETALKGAIGSTGTGGGAALARRITQRGVPAAVRTARDVPELVPYLCDPATVLERAYLSGGRVLIEGTQGTGLSVIHGSFPHVTSRDTSVGTLLAEAGVPPLRLRRIVVTFRAYPIRVGGNSGPMGREITWETVAERSGLAADVVRSTELGSVSGNPRRVAEFSWTQLQKAVTLNGATDIALTFADYIDAHNREARRFDQLTAETVQFIHEVEVVAGAPVSLISAGFDGRGLIDRRRW